MRKLIGLLFVLWTSILFGQTAYGDYYQSASGLKADELKTALYNIIKGHTEYPYTASTTDVWDMLKETDKDPNNPNNVICLYSGRSILAGAAGDEYRNATGWTREHVWAKSHGDFGTGIGPGTDAHHLRPEDDNVNSERNNRFFDNCKDCQEVMDNGVFTGSYIDKIEYTFEPRDAVKGDVARMIFYMATRYEGENGEPDLELTEDILSNTDKTPYHGRLSTLVEWNREDPVDDWERNRNEIIFTQFQHNRNPFIDFPELVEYIWGNSVGSIWEPLGIEQIQKLRLNIYPNPAKGKFFVQLSDGFQANTKIEVFNVMGKLVSSTLAKDAVTEIDLGSMKQGIYFIRVMDGESILTQKFIKQ